jgi:uncharacterized pyridoxamine 5'-phosphate oxidase family protein
MYLKKAAPVIMPCVNLGPPQVRWQGLLFSYEGGM